MIKKLLLFLVCSLLILAPAGYADSLWTSATAPSIFDNQRSFNIGDLVTVMISAESTAVQEAGTTTRKQSDIGAKFFDTFDQYSLDTDGNKSNRKMQDYRIGGDDNYSGVGQTTRKSKVEAIVSCIITRILPNGNLVISGERLVDVNNDSEIIQISGIVRPADIDTKNRIESHQIAQFNISLKGKGVVNSKQAPGFLSNFFQLGVLIMKRVLLVMIIMVASMATFSEEAKVRIKDISRVIESRDNQLIGYGLVVGLRHTGDTQRSVFTEKALTNLLKKMGIKPDKKDFKSRNAASVIVTNEFAAICPTRSKIGCKCIFFGRCNEFSRRNITNDPTTRP